MTTNTGGLFPALFRLDGRTAIVTGASRGIGRTTALMLASAGAHVSCWARSRADLDSLCAEISAAGFPEAQAVNVDVSDPAQVDQAFALTLEKSGAVDILVNNAGAAEGVRAEDMDFDSWRQMMSVNLDSVFLCTRVVGRHLIGRGRGGKIIHMSSVYGVAGSKFSAHYSAAKGAMISHARALALEWARYNIQVNAVAPGFVETAMTRDLLDDPATAQAMLKMIPARRTGTPEEIAAAVLFLAAPSGDYITGHTLTVDGGFTRY